jgi:hypothetical protein
MWVIRHDNTGKIRKKIGDVSLNVPTYNQWVSRGNFHRDLLAATGVKTDGHPDQDYRQDQSV